MTDQTIDKWTFNSDNRTPLCIAARHRDLEKCKVLLDTKWLVSSRDGYTSACYIAMNDSSPKIVRLLLHKLKYGPIIYRPYENREAVRTFYVKEQTVQDIFPVDFLCL